MKRPWGGRRLRAEVLTADYADFADKRNKSALIGEICGRVSPAPYVSGSLELSQQFVIVDQISLTDSAEGVLTMSLHVKTLFRNTEAPTLPRASNRTL